MRYVRWSRIDEVFHNIEGVLETIRLKLNQLRLVLIATRRLRLEDITGSCVAPP